MKNVKYIYNFFYLILYKIYGDKNIHYRRRSKVK